MGFIADTYIDVRIDDVDYSAYKFFEKIINIINKQLTSYVNPDEIFLSLQNKFINRNIFFGEFDKNHLFNTIFDKYFKGFNEEFCHTEDIGDKKNKMIDYMSPQNFLKSRKKKIYKQIRSQSLNECIIYDTKIDWKSFVRSSKEITNKKPLKSHPKKNKKTYY